MSAGTPPPVGAAVQAEGGSFSVTLDYAAPAGCPSADEFRAVVIGRLGYAPFREHASYRVSAVIEPEHRALTGRIEWRDPAGDWVGDQTFASRTHVCGELARAMGFALAVQIQILSAPAASPRAAPSPSPPPPAGTVATPETAPTSTTSSPPPAASTGATASRTASEPQPNTEADRITVDEPGATLAVAAAPSKPATWFVGGGSSVGRVSPSLMAFGRVFGAVAWSHLSLELGTEISLPSTTRREDGAGFAQQLVLLQAAACGDTDRVSGCVIAKGGQLRVTARDVDVPASPNGTFFAMGVRGVVRQKLGERTSVQARAEGLALLAPWVITIDKTTVWSSPRFAGMLGVDLVVRFR